MADVDPQRKRELDRRNRRRRTPRYHSLVLHWIGRWFRRPAAAADSPRLPVEPGQVAVTFGGHATVLIRYHSSQVLCDPMMGRSFHGVVREVGCGLTADDVREVDLVLLSDSDPDHLHLPSLERIPRSATVVVPQRISPHLSSIGFARLVELGAGSSLDHRGLIITAQPVRHGDRDRPSSAYVIRGDGPCLYYCAASGYGGHFADSGREHRPDIAILPIGGYSPPSFRRDRMSPLDALYAFEDLGSRMLVPIGHGTFALSYEQLHDPERWLAELVRERDLDTYVAALRPGETRVFVAPSPRPAADSGPEGGDSAREPSKSPDSREPGPEGGALSAAGVLR